MPPSQRRPAPRPNKNAPTPSTRLPPRYQLKFVELKNLRTPTPQSPVPSRLPLACEAAAPAVVLSWAGLLLERTEYRKPERGSESSREPKETKANAGSRGS